MSLNLTLKIVTCGFLGLMLACSQESAIPRPKVKPSTSSDVKAKDTEKNKDKPKADAPSDGKDSETMPESMEDFPQPLPLPSEEKVDPKPDPIPEPMEMVSKSDGCMAKDTLAEGTHEFTQGKYKRKYIVHRPMAYDVSKPWPVVLALHPNGNNTSFWDGATGDRAIRKLFGDKVIIVLGQAREGDWRGDLPTELAYFEMILQDVKSKLCVDTKKIFSMGFSGGGSFSGVLACMRTDIRAFASGGGMAYFEADKCVGKPAAWITIGDKEAVADRVAYRDFWRKYNGCSEMSVKGKPDTCVEYSCADKERQTVFCSHPGDHIWPNFGSQAAWDFFNRYL